MVDLDKAKPGVHPVAVRLGKADTVYSVGARDCAAYPVEVNTFSQEVVCPLEPQGMARLPRGVHRYADGHFAL